MRQDLRKSATIALTSVLSIALCASLGLSSAQAQGKMSKDKMKMDAMHHEMMMGDDEDSMLPVTPSYPFVNPGMIDMNHWTDYSRMHMKSGSASDAKMAMRHDEMAKGSMAMGSMEDEDDLVPTAPSYPNTQPGMIDMYHWSDSRHKHMMSGSASDAKMEKMKMKNKMVEEDEYDVLPLAPSYPNTQPGMLDMNHWTDFSKMHMMSGSASDARMEKMKMKEMKKMK